jgi:hypothetical protein
VAFIVYHEQNTEPHAVPRLDTAVQGCKRVALKWKIPCVTAAHIPKKHHFTFIIFFLRNNHSRNTVRDDKEL